MAIPKARRFQLTLDTTSPAFKYADGGPAGPELARVLRHLADEVEGVTDEQLLRGPDRLVWDCNSKGIGTYRLMLQ